MVPNLIGTKELENQQYIGQTPHKYVHIDMKMNFMHLSSNLRLVGVSPIYWVKERKHAKWNTWSKHACSRLSKPETKNKEMPSENDTKWRNHHLEDIIKDTSRNEISIGTHQMISNSQKRGWFQTNQALYKVSWWHKYQKETACRPPTHTW